MIIIEKYFCYASSNVFVKAKINSKIDHWEIYQQTWKTQIHRFEFLIETLLW